MPSRTPNPPPDPADLKRVGAGRHATGDGRFTADLTSGGWVLSDAQQANEFGLSLARGPFSTLDEVRQVMGAARAEPAPVSNLAARIAAIPKPRSQRPTPPALPAPPPTPPPVVLREYRSADGSALRELWAANGMITAGDDDLGLRMFVQRNPGLLVVAVQGSLVVGSAMGAWDGRRGWIYHVATAATQRRTGLGRRLVREVEGRLKERGSRRVNVVIRDGNEAGDAFWDALGYESSPSRIRGRNLTE